MKTMYLEVVRKGIEDKRVLRKPSALLPTYISLIFAPLKRPGSYKKSRAELPNDEGSDTTGGEQGAGAGPFKKKKIVWLYKQELWDCPM
ncbi:MAG TPA: hypothetical protein PKC69_08795 [Chitinophagaceae bacterium]|nr:hypothetical protein [Chitinophagaceae bacterium]